MGPVFAQARRARTRVTKGPPQGEGRLFPVAHLGVNRLACRQKKW